MQELAFGFMGLAIIILFWRTETERRRAQEERERALVEKVGLCKMQIEEMQTKLDLMARSQQARMNYESLANVENAAAQLAASMAYDEMAAKLRQSAVEYIARTHNPKNGKKS